MTINIVVTPEGIKIMTWYFAGLSHDVHITGLTSVIIAEKVYCW